MVVLLSSMCSNIFAYEPEESNVIHVWVENIFVDFPPILRNVSVQLVS